MVNALIDLYETEFNPDDLAWATRLAERAIELFEDPAGGFFSTSANQSDLVLRLKDDYDGAEPSGNSVMALGLLRLARITRREGGREDFQRAADRTLEAFRGKMASAGPGLPQMLAAQIFALGKPMEIVLAQPAAEMLQVIRRRFLPNAVVMSASESSAGPCRRSITFLPCTSAKTTPASCRLPTRERWRNYYNTFHGTTRSNNSQR